MHTLHLSLQDLKDYISWPYFFHAWSIPVHQQNSEEAVSLQADALKLLERLSEKGYQAHFRFRLFRAYSQEDDIVLIDKDDTHVHIPFLRQQRTSENNVCLCLSDFVRPLKEEGELDSVGLFAATVDRDAVLQDQQDDYLYLLFSRKNEKALCRELLEAIEEQMGDRLPPLGNPERVAQLLRELVKVSRNHPFTIVLDEFQEMDVVNSGFYGELQGIWDKAQHGQLNLVVSGSVNRMMNKIMFDAGEPLFGRNTAHLQLKPFPVALLKKIFAAHCPKYRREDLLDLWTITGGVARYVALLMDGGAFTREAMLKLVFSPASPFLEEGRIVLAQEFGGDSTNYFSILSSIATGHTRYSEIECDLSLELGSFITNLEKNYHLVKRVLPVYASRGAKNASYRIEDPFFRFWFRYVFRNVQLVELGRFEILRKMVADDLDVFGSVEDDLESGCFRERGSCVLVSGHHDISPRDFNVASDGRANG